VFLKTDVFDSGMLRPQGLCGLEAKLFGLGLVVSGLGLVVSKIYNDINIHYVGIDVHCCCVLFADLKP